MNQIVVGSLFLLTSCHFTHVESGQVLVNQKLIESNIETVQPAERIDFFMQTENNRDSILVVRLTVDPKIPDDSLNIEKAMLIFNSFIAILPNMKSFSTCKIVFFKNDGIVNKKAIIFNCPINQELATQVTNYKDSMKTSMGYIDPRWTYINKSLNLSLPLKMGWFFASEENNSMVFYAIGSDVNQLPLYRTDSDRNVTFQTLQSLSPGTDHAVLEICKNKLTSDTQSLKTSYQGPVISLGLTMNLFGSEDEYLKEYNDLLDKKFLADEIQTYHFGNTNFRGCQFSRTMENGKRVYYLMALRRLRRVSLILRIIYSNTKEFEEIKNELSGLSL